MIFDHFQVLICPPVIKIDKSQQYHLERTIAEESNGAKIIYELSELNRNDSPDENAE
jgi:hypothetical protein